MNNQQENEERTKAAKDMRQLCFGLGNLTIYKRKFKDNSGSNRNNRVAIQWYWHLVTYKDCCDSTPTQCWEPWERERGGVSPYHTHTRATHGGERETKQQMSKIAESYLCFDKSASQPCNYFHCATRHRDKCWILLSHYYCYIFACDLAAKQKMMWWNEESVAIIVA